MSYLFDWYFRTTRNFFQGQYDSVINLFGGNDFNLDIWATFLLSISVYWFLGSLYTILDLTQWPKFLYKYKIQDNEKVTLHKILPVLKQVVINQTLVSITFGIFIHYIKMFIGHNESPEIPTLFRIFKDWIVFMIFGEMGFYYSHRLAHHPKIYKYIHKRHHEWQTPIAITAVYCHPLEHIFVNLAPAFLGPIIMQSHRFTIWLWLVYITLITLNDHSGYHFPLVFSPEYHDYHHFKFNQNYGNTGFFDWLHGTDQKFRKTKAYQRNRILTSFTPIKYIYPDFINEQNNNNSYKKK